jgi:hypothetical protein
MSRPVAEAAPTVSPAAAGAMAARAGWRPRREALIVALLVGLALVRGLLYGGIAWPWYAPDEPDHAELALLTREFGPDVAPEQTNHDLRLAIAQSLYEWRVTDRPPRPEDAAPGRWAGQIGRQPPLYYLIAGWAAGLAPDGDIVGQLQAMRLASAVLGALVVAAIYLAGRLLDPAEPLLALGLAGVALFQTTVGALSGAVSNDILAVLGVTLTLAACIHLAWAPAGGARPIVVGGLALALALTVAVLAKRTTAFVTIPALLALAIAATPGVLGWLRARRLTWIGAGVALGGLLIFGVVLLGGAEEQAAGWRGFQAERAPSPAPTDGRHVMQLGRDAPSGLIQQRLTSAQLVAMRGQTVTVGMWARAGQATAEPRPVTVRLELKVGGRTSFADATARPGDEWQFVSVTAPVGPTTSAGAISASTQSGGSPLLIDGATLVVGSFAGAPTAAGPTTLVWEGRSAVNLMDNPGFEERPFGLRPWAQRVVERLINRPYAYLFDDDRWPGRTPETWEEWQINILEPFFETLWGRLGRTTDLNLPPWWYRAHAVLLSAACVGGLVAGVVALARRRVTARHAGLGALLALTLLGSAVVAVGPYVLGIYAGPPFGRYFLPALLPLAAIYVGGLVLATPRSFRPLALLALLGVMAALDAYALFAFMLNHFGIRPPAVG